MKFYNNEKEMPLGEIEIKDKIVHHLVCEGSRRHVVSYYLKNNKACCKCSEPRCEINKEGEI